MIRVELPVYKTKTFKKKDKKPVTYLVGMNKFRNMHHYEKNSIKQEYSQMIKEQLEGKHKKLNGTYAVCVYYYYKSTVSDLDNVSSLMIKFFNDALQELGLVENDNVKHCVCQHSYVVEQDKDNPRVYLEAFEVIEGAESV